MGSEPPESPRRATCHPQTSGSDFASWEREEKLINRDPHVKSDLSNDLANLAEAAAVLTGILSPSALSSQMRARSARAAPGSEAGDVGRASRRCDRGSSETEVKVKSIYFKKGQGKWTRTSHMKTDKQKIGPDSSSHSCRHGRFKAPTGRRPRGRSALWFVAWSGGRWRVGSQNPLWCEAGREAAEARPGNPPGGPLPPTPETALPFRKIGEKQGCAAPGPTGLILQGRKGRGPGEGAGVPGQGSLRRGRDLAHRLVGDEAPARVSLSGLFPFASRSHPPGGSS